MKKRNLIDLHTHGLGRYDTRTGRPEDIVKLAEMQAKAGVSAILPAIYAAPIDEMRKNLFAVKEAMRETSGNKKGCKPLGAYLEGPFLNPARCGALDKTSFLNPSISALKSLINGFEDIIKIIAVAPELPGALRLIERCAEAGIKVHMGHSDATFEEARKGKLAGATGITHLFNAMRPFHHREPGLAGFGLMDEDVYIEVIGDGIHLHPEMLKFIFRVKKTDRILLVSDSVKGPMYKKGVLQGSNKSLSDAVSFLLKAGIPRRDVVKAANENPKRYLGIYK